jgi:UDP-N-acetylglucosamine kinase
MAAHDCPESDFLSRIEGAYRKLVRGRKAVQKPSAYLTGGQSGAGKSLLHEIARTEQNGNIVIIDGDSFRNLHPEYRELMLQYGRDSVLYTQEFSSKMTESLIEKISDGGFNVMVEGTLRTSDIPRETAAVFKKKKYVVNLFVMIVKPALSYISTIQRYEKMYALNPMAARMTPKAHHDLIVSVLIQNIDILYRERIFDRIQLYDRGKRLLYSSIDTPEATPSEIAENEMYGNWTEDEIEMGRHSVGEIFELMERRGARDSVEWKQIEKFAGEIPTD